MTKKDRKALVKKLPRSYAKIIAEKTGKNPIYIWQVLNGDRNNEQILEAAIALAEEEKQRQDSITKRIHSL